MPHRNSTLPIALLRLEQWRAAVWFIAIKSPLTVHHWILRRLPPGPYQVSFASFIKANTHSLNNTCWGFCQDYLDGRVLGTAGMGKCILCVPVFSVPFGTFNWAWRWFIAVFSTFNFEIMITFGDLFAMGLTGLEILLTIIFETNIQFSNIGERIKCLILKMCLHD